MPRPRPGIYSFVFLSDVPSAPVQEVVLQVEEEGMISAVVEMRCSATYKIDLIRNYGPGTRDGASGFDRAAGTVASCSFVVEEFDR